MRSSASLALGLGLLLGASGCGMLGPKRAWMPLRPSADLVERLGANVFQAELESCQLAENAVYRTMIDAVMKRLLTALSKTLFGQSTRGLPWNVQIVVSDDINAAAFPGGGIFVNTGLLDGFAKFDEGFLAVALAHEIVHVARGHLRDRLEQDEAVAAAALRGVEIDKLTPEIILKVLLLMGLGELRDVSPFVKQQELEADHLGVYLLALADYDPALAVKFWESMAMHEPGDSAFNFTHPGVQERLAQLRSVLPDVQRYRDACVHQRARHNRLVKCQGVI